jgi:UDP-N-acetylmuramoyl-tripeptide--D-alanyl-D-alanine ligase
MKVAMCEGEGDMEGITVRDIVEATQGTLLCGDENTAVTDICIDSREIKEGDLFVPIIGERVNPHKFIEQVLEVGAATLTSEHYAITADKPYIKVKDTLQALQDIGRYVRERLDIPFVAVTGSVGKTTTRNMIATALRSKLHTFETQKNYNGQIGVPIMIARISAEDEIAVLECGMSEFGQIARLSDLVKPKYAVVSTIGVAHIEYLKTQENIRKEKLSIIDSLQEDGILFLNGDDSMLAEMKGRLPVTTMYYGTEHWCDYYADNIQYDNGRSYFECVHGDQRVPVELSVLGKHNVLNCVAALAVSHTHGIALEDAAAQFAHFCGMRQKIIELENRFRIIDDTYNASPDSMRASLDVLCHIEAEGRRIAVLGDMFELGDDSELYHYQVGEYLATLPIDELVVVGNHAKQIRKALQDCNSKIKNYEFSENEEAAMYLLATLMPGDIVLIKGSNGMKMDEIVRVLMQ